MSEFVIYNMDVFKALKKIPVDSVDCVFTSPPYWGLRDYGVNGQIGLEDHPNNFIDTIVQVFEEIKKILKPTGSIWLNLGDTYFGSGEKKAEHKNNSGGIQGDYAKKGIIPENKPWLKLKSNWLQSKQKLLMPHRIAIAMQDKGWVLRNDIIWRKKNSMPSSVRDRFRSTFEFIFFFTKSKKYYFDLHAVRVPHKSASFQRARYKVLDIGAYAAGKKLVTGFTSNKIMDLNSFGANPGDVLETSSEGFSEAHFATFPAKLPKFGLKAGCPKEVCKKCGKPRERIVEPTEEYKKLLKVDWKKSAEEKGFKHTGAEGTGAPTIPQNYNGPKYETIGWTDCGCKAGFKPGLVLDPFAGSGTTLKVAKELGLNGIGIELSKDYIPMIEKRINKFRYKNTWHNQFKQSKIQVIGECP